LCHGRTEIRQARVVPADRPHGRPLATTRRL
jgi:hypothetical protein